MSTKFYITTPIYYPNGQPHLGHVYTTLAADVLARFHRLAGDETWFLTGTDEHGIKMVKTADELNVSPQALADENANVFASLWKELNVTNDDFIRTSSPRHKAGATEIVRKMQASGDIYLGSYEGWYDEGQEEFITETEAKAADFKSAVSGRPLSRYKESTYFFKLTKYVDRVYAAIESDQIRLLPVSRKNEILSKLKGWNADLSISRSSLKWGIPMPDDSEHVLYVWIDALSNYITALDYAGDASPQFQKFWPADVHLIGKEILWFHAFYWPAMLMSLGLPLPKVLFAHGWWTSDGKKMSKSMGNFIDLDRVRATVATYSLGALRYYLLRAAPFGADLDWKDAEVVSSYTELGNVVGNLLNRTLNMIGKYRAAAVPAAPSSDLPEAAPVRQLLAGFAGALASAYGELELQRAALLPVELARATNVFIDQTQPFRLAKSPAQAAALDGVLNLCAQACKSILVGLLPILPEKAEAGLRQLNIDPAGKTLANLLAEPLPDGHPLGTAEVLFPKLV